MGNRVYRQKAKNHFHSRCYGKKIQFVFLKQTHSQDAKSVPIEFHSFKINKSLRQFSLNISGQQSYGMRAGFSSSMNLTRVAQFQIFFFHKFLERNQMILELENGVNLKSFLVRVMWGWRRSDGTEMRIMLTNAARPVVPVNSLLLAFYTVVPDVSQQFGLYLFFVSS